MRIGISTAQTGRLAGPSAVRAAARAAEQIGYSTIWVVDRLPAVDALGAPGDARPGALDPFVVLAATAAVTSRVRIGTGVLVAPRYRAAVLARMLTSLDVMSDGRLVAGVGPGSDRIGRRGRDLEAVLDVLDAEWTDPSCGSGGPLDRGADARGRLRPVQRPRPPLLLAAQSRGDLDRIARRADGWLCTGIAPETARPLWGRVRARAAALGRDPDGLELVVRADIELSDAPMEGERIRYHGCFEQVVDDIEQARAAGAHEVILRLGGDPTLDETLDVYARIAETVAITT